MRGARILKFVKKINFMLLLNVKSVKIGLADSERNIYLHLMIQSKKCYVLLPNKKIGIGIEVIKMLPFTTVNGLI